ncbi:PfkB family carbohydrate kinase [Muricauda sp. ANG21]|uniref:1-phosphofructokinase family hexose kinase n=1 Tax=Allomuricauda sp. ANG21 TaxID=3042468 RepID=UPI0034522CCC
MDTLEVGGVNRVTKEFSYPGGKGVHVALGIRELGEDVTLLSFWGGDIGNWIKKECQERGIHCVGPEVEHWNRTCLTIKSKDDFNETEILGTGPFIGDLEYNLLFDQYKKLLKNTKIVCMSGSWPINSFNANYAEFVKYASQLQIKSFVDCSGDSLKKVLGANPYLLHINHKEAYELYADTNIEKNIAALKQHCCLAVISKGNKGLFLYDGENIVHALSKVDNVISAVGSGDSLMAATVVACKRGHDQIEMAKLAAAAGASNCIREELGMFHKKDVERLYKECIVNVKRLT